ncbi:hypothetical protein H112_06590 [Trichophyton rubrum D6]|uniref:Uncharacterized protein n=3 Tax=Trichophyton TaxID=5550 RepID=A0A080WHG1_TRIRC|nr:uncharacterized protein TERG_11781 [Trichophyton rubrum CBS 118892]EZF12471.1 hypothetical protein H100_06607 [Trichophyton rubrum MR850]EZF39236.1 hypothetical protein H102_06574 [Trichophyton rubrum CBS 100081]EZF49883.1 hypothetical protein H103_06599 [Trichophyton rubrum CBS 288.86]EZF60519.1 hypothetical protein H104_06554 [Trichophyton rubrum CBS 289.86]EZF71204.1 hypothetical protein H105_06611 [Trichophyton soudanense CBS 452.61]EZF81710.1 hypothetical protein H110_06594 [Trichophy
MARLVFLPCFDVHKAGSGIFASSISISISIQASHPRLSIHVSAGRRAWLAGEEKRSCSVTPASTFAAVDQQEQNQRLARAFILLFSSSLLISSSSRLYPSFNPLQGGPGL